MKSRNPNKHYNVNSHIASHAKISRSTLTHIPVVYFLSFFSINKRQNERKLNVPIYLTNNEWLENWNNRSAPHICLHMAIVHISINWMQSVCAILVCTQTEILNFIGTIFNNQLRKKIQEWWRVDMRFSYEPIDDYV